MAAAFDSIDRAAEREIRRVVRDLGMSWNKAEDAGVIFDRLREWCPDDRARVGRQTRRERLALIVAKPIRAEGFEGGSALVTANGLRPSTTGRRSAGQPGALILALSGCTGCRLRVTRTPRWDPRASSKPSRVVLAILRRPLPSESGTSSRGADFVIARQLKSRLGFSPV